MKKVKNLLPIISIIISLFAICQAQRAMRISEEANDISKDANTIAQEANQIAIESQKSQVSVSYLYPVGDYRDYYKEPCLQPAVGNAYWGLEYAPVFDITNTSSQGVSLRDISFNGKVLTKDECINAHVNFTFFESPAEFSDWFITRDFTPVGGRVRQSLDNSTFTGPPIYIGPGETKRLFLRGIVYVNINPDLSLTQVFELHGYPFWNNTITFIFGDGTQIDVSVYVPGPFDGVPGVSGDYKECSYSRK
jgi:hypothetical protein